MVQMLKLNGTNETILNAANDLVYFKTSWKGDNSAKIYLKGMQLNKTFFLQSRTVNMSKTI
jgi:hypothetical protein